MDSDSGFVLIVYLLQLQNITRPAKFTAVSVCIRTSKMGTADPQLHVALQEVAYLSSSPKSGIRPQTSLASSCAELSSSSRKTVKESSVSVRDQTVPCSARGRVPRTSPRRCLFFSSPME